MAQRRDDARFLLEALEPMAVDGELFRKKLERDETVEARVARAEDLAHAPRPDALDELVGSELEPGAAPAGVLTGFGRSASRHR